MNLTLSFFPPKGVPGYGEKGEPGKPGPRVSSFQSLFIPIVNCFPYIPRITGSGTQKNGRDWEGFSGFSLSSPEGLF